MATTSDIFLDAFDRIAQVVHAAVDGLTPDQLATRPAPDANSIAWLVWHLTRIQDDHVADVAGWEQLWTDKGWADRFALPFDADATGYGHSRDDVAAVRGLGADLLVGYLDAVHATTRTYLTYLNDTDLDRIVDVRWDPPVTLAVRLVSVVSDSLQHAGQASYVRGLLGA